MFGHYTTPPRTFVIVTKRAHPVKCRRQRRSPATLRQDHRTPVQLGLPASAVYGCQVKMRDSLGALSGAPAASMTVTSHFSARSVIDISLKMLFGRRQRVWRCQVPTTLVSSPWPT